MRMNLSQWRARVAALVLPQSRPKPARENRAEREPVWWRYPLARGEITVQAHTKGEARAFVKRQLKLPRLPAGATVERV